MRKNTITTAMMVSSLVLLLLLQLLWLRSAFRSAEDDFRKETNALFRNTIFTMHDSLIQRSIHQVGSDSVNGAVFRKRITFREPSGGPLPDTLIDRFNITERSAKIEIITTEAKGDTLDKILRPLIARLSKTKRDPEPKTFIFNLVADSLAKDSIKVHFTKSLDDAGIDLDYEIMVLKGGRRTRDGWKLGLPPESYISEIVPFTPGVQYAATFAEVRPFLISKMAPQILFAIFVTLLTSVSFFVMHRNLRTQQKLMQIKNDFISNVTHELKTPVATVSVALEALKNFKALNDPKKTNEYLDIAQSELNRLTLMTDKILKTSVFENHGVEVKREPVDLEKTIQQVLSSLKLVFEKKGTQVSFEKSGTDFIINGSETDITHVLFNLIDNAIKYGGEAQILKISLTASEKTIQIIVKDSGIGIPDEYQKRIFEKFFRVPSGDIHNIKGYGLGLSYVAGVVAAHGGRISVASEPGNGSTFLIDLPRKSQI